MTISWPANISQVGYPGAGDVDDCWVVATIWAASASDPTIRKPTVTEFRRHAGDPDDGVNDGGSLDEVIKGSRGCWPDLDVTRWESRSWDAFDALLLAGRPASVALDSGQLPSAHRYGFYGKHQCGVAYDSELRTRVLANPLAPQGSAPKPITEAALERAVMALLPAPWGPVVRAAVYPAPTEEETVPIPVGNTGDYRVALTVGDQLYDEAFQPSHKVTTAQTARGMFWTGTGFVGIRYSNRLYFVKSSEVTVTTNNPPGPAQSYKVTVGGKTVGSVTLP